MSEAAKIRLLLRRGILPPRILEPEAEVANTFRVAFRTWRWRSPEGSRLPSAKPSRRSGRTYERLPSLPARNDHRFGPNSSSIGKRLVNLNAQVYGRVYFPVRSNSLKVLGKFLGASWTEPECFWTKEPGLAVPVGDGRRSEIQGEAHFLQR